MKNSIFTKVLALVLCVIMLAGTLTACLHTVEFNPSNGTTTENGGKTEQSTTSGGDTTTTPPETTTTTGDDTTENPSEDPAEDPEEDPVDPNELYSGKTTLESDSLLYGTLANDVFIGDESVAAMIPADVKVEAGASALALSIKNVEEATTVDGEALSNLDVHISGIALDNTVPMTVMLGAILPIGLANTELKLYHVENGTPVLMTRVASVNDFAIHNQYVYNAETGVVTIYVASFSVFTAVQTTADVWDGTSDTSWYNTTDTEFTLTTAAQFAGFRDIVDGTAIINGETVQDSFAGKTVKLGVDVDLGATKTVQVEKEVDGQTQLVDVTEKIPFDPIGFGYTYDRVSDTAFMGTFDGGNHTVYNLYQNGWDLDSDKTNYSTYTYSTAGGGLFASIEGTEESPVVIKNLAVSGADIVMECIDMGIVVGYAQGNCHFENIVVTDSRIANYNRATGGVVGEVCYGSYGTDVELGYSHTFENITVDSSVVVSSLWGSFDTLCGGVIGGKWGDATVKMTNVNVAARLDVFSDVTAAYEWYAYRRCGMLIGHTEQNSPKKALNAAAEFLTCENVNVYYGDWVNYSYCQFTQYGYPWARVQAGEYHSAYANPRIGVAVDINGKTVVDNNHAHKDGEGHNLVIKFNQLYGGGQGVYGTNKHEGNGVTINYSLKKTIYIENNKGWENLKLYYWFANGESTWTTLDDGIDMSTMLVENTTNVYKLEIPAYAYGFKILADGDKVTPELILSELAEDEINLVDIMGRLSVNIKDGTSFVASNGNWLYNTAVTYNTASQYDIIIYDHGYMGAVTTNHYGVAIVLDKDGNLIKIYDGANVAYYDTNGKAATTHFTAVTFASVAWSELQVSETLIIFPNDGSANTDPNGNLSRKWALSLRPNGSNPSIGKIVTIEAEIHYCTKACDICGGCKNLQCKEPTCVANRCTCMTLSINGNEFVAAGGDWIYNVGVSATTAPHYDVVIYDKNFSGTFTTNSYGVAIVLDANGKLSKVYDGANAGYWIEGATEANKSHGVTVSNFATLAWSELGEGETLIIFPNDGGDNVARKWALDLRTNGSLGKVATLIANNNVPKTIYFQNNWKWSEVYLYYWFEDDTHNADFPGTALIATDNDGIYDIYKIVIPAGVKGVILSGTNPEKQKQQTYNIDIADLVSGYIYWCSMGTNEYNTDGTLNKILVDLSGNKYTEGYATHDIYLKGDFNNWVVDDAYRLTPSNDGKTWTGTFTFEKTVKIKLFNTLILDEKGWINGAGYSDNVELAPGKYTITYSVANNTFTYNMTTRILYLTPNSNWNVDNARFAVYAFNSDSDNKWYSMTKQNDGTYKVEIDAKYAKVIFCRMNPNATANNWNNKWNQTGDLNAGDGSWFKVPSGAWDGSTTGWSKK